MTDTADLIFKIVDAGEWRAAEWSGQFVGSAVDLRDGFIHFSTAEQVVATAARHFAGVRGLVIVGVSAVSLPIRWEPARGGALFPHLYVPLPLSAVKWVRPLPIGVDGMHEFPSLEAPGGHA